MRLRPTALQQLELARKLLQQVADSAQAVARDLEARDSERFAALAMELHLWALHTTFRLGSFIERLRESLH